MTDKVPVTFVDACAIADDMLYVAALIDDTDNPYTRLFILNPSLPENWFHHDFPYEEVVSVAFKPMSQKAARACLALSNSGSVEVLTSDSLVIEDLFERESMDLSSFRGGMKHIEYIGSRTYACGSGNQVFRRDGVDQWVEIGSTIKKQADIILDDIVTEIHESFDSNSESALDIISITKKMREFTCLNCISGVDENNIYACGTNGVIWHWNGKTWNSIKSGTKQHLQDIHVVSEKEIFVCGYNGTLLAGNHEQGFHRVLHGRLDINFWNVRYFKEKVYLGSSIGLFCLNLKDNKLDNISNEIEMVPSSHAVASIDSTQDVLWVIADKFVLRLKDDWQIITHPDNV